MPTAIPGGTVVLVVDDEPLVRLSAVAMMEAGGHEAYEAESADEAIEILEAHPEITIVFTDIQMAGSMDGLALAKYAAGRWPPLKFIIVSGGVKPEADAMPGGAFFFGKPYRENEIAQTIRGFL